MTFHAMTYKYAYSIACIQDLLKSFVKFWRNVLILVRRDVMVISCTVIHPKYLFQFNNKSITKYNEYLSSSNNHFVELVNKICVKINLN